MSGARRAGRAAVRVPTIIPIKGPISADVLEQRCPVNGAIYACDFYVMGAESWTPEAGGLRSGRILNVDHHAKLEQMDAPITSTRLAVDHVRTAGVAGPGSWVVINHTDCDSVLSSGIMLGMLPPDEDLVFASVCADHTGEPNDIADLLQAIDEIRTGDRTVEQYAESMSNLRVLLQANEVLDPAAAVAMVMREEKRAAAAAVAERFDMRDGVAFAVHEGGIDGALLTQRLKDAVVIMLAVPDAGPPGNWVVKLRRGLVAPPGFSLHALGIEDWDANYGGRANAGSNKRGGGTSMSRDNYAVKLRERLRQRPNTSLP